MPNKAFQAARREQKAEPITFTLGRDEAAETFACVDTLPAWVLLDLAAASDDDSRASAQATIDLFREILVEGDFDRFVAAARRRQSDNWDALDDSMIGDLISWLMEHYTGRPTQQPSRSRRRSSTDTKSSKVVSLSQGTVRAVS